MATLVSVNVGMPRKIQWQGKAVRTAIWKTPVAGRVFAGRLNLMGDGQADLAGHGGEQRAVLVYQLESYRHWQDHLGRQGMELGIFGENFTVEGLPDNEVCVGDQYRIGSALFEVSQPRVTCYRLGIRLNHPQMPGLLTSSGRPGFYLRVLEEGEIGAGDRIELVAKGPQAMSVVEINALLYSSSHPRDQLERALQIPSLSPGWRGSFEALLQKQIENPGATGNAGLVSQAALRPAVQGFRPLRVQHMQAECADVVSLMLGPVDSTPLAMPLPGQFIVLRFRPAPGDALVYRSYSLSGRPSTDQYRISVRLEPDGIAGAFLKTQLRAGDIIEVSAPRGSFTLQPGVGRMVLLSAGIGITPMLAMLHDLAASTSPREIWWIHGARNRRVHAFAGEAKELLGRLPDGRRSVWYSQPDGDDVPGEDYDAVGRIGIEALKQLAIPLDADFYLCGPASFLEELNKALTALGVPWNRVHSEAFSGLPPLTPGLAPAPQAAPHQPSGNPGTGPLVCFSRSGITTRWRSEDQSLLELAESCNIPVRWSCRAGICHNCESGLISGTVSYDPLPFDPPAETNVLICCSRPQGDIVIDL